MPPSQLGAFAKSDPSQPTANIEWHVQPLSLDKFGSPLHRYNAITPSVCNLRPSSRGTVALKSANPHDAPAIAPNYLSTAEDLDVAVAGLRYTRKIMAAPALAAFNPTELKPGPDIQSEEDLQRAAGDWAPPFFIQLAPARWDRDTTAMPWLMMNSECMASKACESSMPRSCPQSPPATPMLRL